MRRVAAASILVLCSAAGSYAGDEPAARPPFGIADWEARDGEARWTAYRASVDRAGGPSDEDWIASLAQRKEWDLLEWIALTSRRSEALDALAKADAPQWIRCALWRRFAADSHAMEAASKWFGVGEVRPGLIVAWLERFPSAAPELLKALKADDPKREDASKYLGPLDPAVVFRILAPPAELEDLGDRTQVRPGARYAHQVERALAALEQTRLAADLWTARVPALLTHAHPKVRRAAALAFAHAPFDKVPLAALTARLDDGEETLEVRAAALLGLSYSRHPSAYATLVRVAGDPKHPAWRAAVSRLGDVDDGFFFGAAHPVVPASAEDAGFLIAQAERWTARASSKDTGAFASRVEPLLERAAWADLARDPLAGSLVPWTLRTIHAWMGEPGVREQVQEAAAEEGVPPPGPVAGGVTPEAMRDRVRRYAADVLSGDEKSFGPR